jgi:peptide/histidine transporter 3/4
VHRGSLFERVSSPTFFLCAFTYCDDHIPSRIDFAKERYGGPFSTEQVENVKTFFRMLIVLLSMGPVFMLEVPGSYLFLPLFSLHTFHNYKHMGKQFCSNIEHTWEIIFVSSGTLMSFLTTVILFPCYIFTVFYLLCKKAVRIFSRIQLGIVLCLLGVLSLLSIDLIGHSLNSSNTSNHTQCMFQVYRMSKGILDYPSLNMHWSVLIPPNLLLGIGPLIVITTTFEFISAQSPLSMKGLIIGVFFSIRGLFQFLNSVVIIPFSLKRPWASGEMLENPPVTNCGFVYLLFTCVVGLIGLILFSVAAKKYKYRQRDEGLFRQQAVEEIYDRYLTEAQDNSIDSSDEY